MMDKSLPYYRLILKRPAGAPLPERALPKGYTLTPFTDGDEADWAEIETAVDEFPRAVDALRYFQQSYLPARQEVELRTLFLIAPDGRKVGTVTLWWGYTGLRRDPWLHWVAVRPELQGQGLGKAMVAQALRRFLEIEGDRAIYLPTQTWSSRAVNIYRWAGFDFCYEPGAGGFDNQTQQGLEIIRNRLR